MNDHVHAATMTTHEAEVFFESKVRPLLIAKCHECHGPSVSEAGLRLDSRQGLLLGSDTGAVVIPGNAKNSKLVAAVKHTDNLAMPPDTKLSDEEINILETWIAAGALWPVKEGATPELITREQAMQDRMQTSLASHWSFQPPKPQVAHDPKSLQFVPPDVASQWSQSPIDRFILEGLATNELTPSPEAHSRDLFRRLYYNLTGLPPSATDADAFEANPSEEAYRSVIEKLLTSKEHAEHWGRHWLDLARYADTMGYAFAGQSPLYPFAWTYRDWVIDSFHQDRSYNDFITLQLAADRIRPKVPRDDLAALGFLTVGRTFLGNPHDIIDDQIDLVTRGLMGLTVACARCHDHKYEPLSTADYYALHGVFASCEIPDELPVIGEAPSGPEAVTFRKQLKTLESRIAEHKDAVHKRAIHEAIDHAPDYFMETARPLARPDGRPPKIGDYELSQLLIDRLKRLLGGANKDHPILGPWIAVKNLPDEEIHETLTGFSGPAAKASNLNALVLSELIRSQPTTLRSLAEVYKRLIARVAPDFAGGDTPDKNDSADLIALRKTLGLEATPLIIPYSDAMRVAKRTEREELRKREQAVTKHRAESPGGPPRAMVLLDKKNPVDSHVFLRGNSGRSGPKINRRLPQLLGGTPLSRTSSGRLELAQSIVSCDNPLTSRVLVNWVWAHHFGNGLVSTPGDLGLRGELPSNQALLDDLSFRFMHEGQWSLRWLHREIVLSKTWRQSAAIRSDLSAKDPDNHFFGRANRRRLSWEAWRDSLLTAAGTLERKQTGGRGKNPLDLASMSSRSIYSWLDRQDVPGLLRTFDIANPDTAVHIRTRTTVPQQGLAVINSPLVVESAKRLALRVTQQTEKASEAQRITELWRNALSRNPSEKEISIAKIWLKESSSYPTINDFGPWARLAQAILGTAEFQFID